MNQAVWDAFRPRSCDTHSMSYSATRETFMKLLRPGVDYREAFHKVNIEVARTRSGGKNMLCSHKASRSCVELVQEHSPLLSCRSLDST